MRILLLFILIAFSGSLFCQDNKADTLEFFSLTAEQENIIYSGITNQLHITQRPKYAVPKYLAHKNCKIYQQNEHLYVTPDSNAEYVRIQVIFNDSVNRYFLFHVKHLPEPRLTFHLGATDYFLPNQLDSKNISDIYYLRGQSDIGWHYSILYKVESYQILILRDTLVVNVLNNQTGMMSEENKKALSTLQNGDYLIFRNINLKYDDEMLDYLSVDNNLRFIVNEKCIAFRK